MNFRKTARFITAILLSLTMFVAPLTSYAAPTVEGTAASQTANAGLAKLETAVANKDINTILDYSMDQTRPYYLAHGLEDSFQYFDAEKYLQKYPDLTAAFGTDKKKALEHYVTFGYKEDRISCGTYDIPLYLRKNPEKILDAELLKNVSDPEVYFRKLSDMTEKAQSKGATGPGAASGGSSVSVFYPVTDSSQSTYPDEVEEAGEAEELEPQYSTVMFYVSGSNLENDYGEMTTAILDAMLGMCGTEKVNLVMALGASKSWHSDYLNTHLAEEKNAIFSVNGAELKTAVDKIAGKYGDLTVEQLFTMAHKDNDTGKAMKAELISKLFTGKVLPKVQDIPGAMSEQYALDTLLDVATTKYKAESYSLFFNGHGGGATGTMAEVSVPSIRAALSKAGFGSALPKLSYLAMDGCLMGSVEVATYLSDYYLYMYASEVTTYGDQEYYSMLRTVCTYKDNGYVILGSELAYRGFENRITYYRDDTLITTAIFDASKAKETEKAVDDVAAALLAKANADEVDKSTVMFAVKKASLKCCQVTGGATRSEGNSYVDAADFLNVLKEELHTSNINEFDTLIDTAIQKLDDFTTFNGFNFDNTVMYKCVENGVVTVPLNDLWKKYMGYHLGTPLSSSTLLVPNAVYTFVDIDSSAYEKDEQGRLTEDGKKAFDVKILENKKLFKDDYYSRYHGTGLSHYCELMDAFIDYYLTEEEMTRISKLAKELLTGKDENGNAVNSYEDLVNVKLNEDASLLKVEIDFSVYDEEKKEKKSKNTSYDLFVDLMDTVTAMKVYITRKIQAKYSDIENTGIPVTLDMIIGEKTVEYLNINGVGNSINVLTESLLDTCVCFPMYQGSDEQITSYYDDVLYVSDLDRDTQKKIDLILSFDTEYQTLKNKAETEADQEKKEKLDAEVAAYRQEFEDKKLYEDYYLYRGSCKYKESEGEGSEKVQDSVELLFRINSNRELVYERAVEVKEAKDNEQKTVTTYTNVNNVTAVSFYHYMVKENTIDEDVPTAIEEQAFEQGSQWYWNYTDVSVGGFYSISQDTSLFINYWTTLEKMDSNTAHNGYLFSVIDQRTYQTCLNDGNKAATAGDENYQGIFDLKTTADNIAAAEKKAAEEADKSADTEKTDVTVEETEETAEAAEAEEKTEDETMEIPNPETAEQESMEQEAEIIELPAAQSQAEEASEESFETLPEVLSEESAAEGLLPGAA